MVAKARGLSLAEYLSELIRGPVDRDFLKVMKQMESVSRITNACDAAVLNVVDERGLVALGELRVGGDVACCALKVIGNGPMIFVAEAIFNNVCQGGGDAA